MAEYYSYGCQACGGVTKITDTRRVDFNGQPTIVRTRKCNGCAKSSRTYEMPIEAFRPQLTQYAKLKVAMRPFFEEDQRSAKSEKVEQSAGPKKAEADEDNSWKTTRDYCS